MKYISSDASVWIDFAKIERLNLPFLLDYVYLMFSESVDAEMIAPPGLGSKLVDLGLEKTELTETEFFQAENYAERYRRLSIYDSIALAIAKVRGYVLMTGDKALRSAAIEEGVECIGTIGILDCLKEEEKITGEEFRRCIKKLLELNGKGIRLPVEELIARLDV